MRARRTVSPPPGQLFSRGNIDAAFAQFFNTIISLMLIVTVCKVGPPLLSHLSVTRLVQACAFFLATTVVPGVRARFAPRCPGPGSHRVAPGAV